MGSASWSVSRPSRLVTVPRIAVVFLVDSRGHVLLQHRDEHAPRAPDRWGMVGGHVEPGEDFDTAVHRELLEETGIATGPGDLALWQESEFTYSDGHRSDYRVYAGRVDLTDGDIVLGEGRAIVFRDPVETAALDQAESCAYFLPLFLASDLYRRLWVPGAPVPPSRLVRTTSTRSREQSADGSSRADHGSAGPA